MEGWRKISLFQAASFALDAGTSQHLSLAPPLLMSSSCFPNPEKPWNSHPDTPLSPHPDNPLSPPGEWAHPEQDLALLEQPNISFQSCTPCTAGLGKNNPNLSLGWKNPFFSPPSGTEASVRQQITRYSISKWDPFGPPLIPFSPSPGIKYPFFYHPVYLIIQEDKWLLLEY